MTTVLQIPCQKLLVCNNGRQLLFVVSHHNHRLVSSLTERFYHILYKASVPQVKSVQRLVQYQQLGVFYEGSCQQHQSLFATR